MRLDKFLSEQKIATRSQIKALLKQGTVTVNGQIIQTPDIRINENTDTICFQGKILTYQKFVYYMLNKPAGVVSATSDHTCQTVLDLLPDKTVFPVGRLDKDTEGLLVLTNDGELAHRLLSPQKHVAKKYFIKMAHELLTDQVSHLKSGIDIGEKSLTRPAIVEVTSNPTEIYLTITEGKFHQVKRMLQAVNNEVLYLKRVSMGGVLLDPSLALGESRSLTNAEIHLLQEAPENRKK